MIRLIREGSKKYPWILKIIILVIAVTFTIGMGWFGYEQSQQPNALATIGPYQVSRQEFRRAYNNTYRFFKDQLKQEDIDEESLKLEVMDGLVGSKVWLVTAEAFDLEVSPAELRQSIVERKEFQRDGKFNPQYYHRLLAANRMTPKQYEAQLTRDLLTEKAQLIAQDVASLTPAEIEEVEELTARQTTSVEDTQEIDKVRKRIRLQFLLQKKQRALQAFQAAMRTKSEVNIREEYL